MRDRDRINWAALTAVVMLFGCGSQPTPRPANAVVLRPTAHPAHGPWTKEDKLAAINRAPISADQKKAEIARVQSGQD